MLSYAVKGFTYPIEHMDAAERTWFLRRLDKQLKAEEKALKE